MVITVVLSSPFIKLEFVRELPDRFERAGHSQGLGVEGKFKIKINILEMEYVDVDWIRLAQDWGL